MKSKLLVLMALVLTLFGVSATAKKVHTIGDSTMAPYDESATVTRGWGMYFGQFLTNGWTSVNYAKGGRDSRGGYNELWQNAKNNVEAGDYVLIQFAHNDEKLSGVDREAYYNYLISKGMTTEAAALDTRGTTPSTTYKEWLAKIVDEVKARGANPILVGPVCRSYFTGSTIRRNGRHDLGDSFSVLTADGIKEKQSVGANDHLMDYPYHMQQLAEEKQVPYVDLTTATKELYESYGDAKCHEQLFDGDGSTHFNTTGALLVARLCAQLMKEQGIMTDDIVVPTDLSIAPETADLGEAYKGQTLTKELTLNGFGLSPAEGTITLSASDGIELSIDKQSWAQTQSVSYRNGTLVQTFYARVVLTTAGQFSGTITATLGDKVITVPLTATAVELGSGTPFRAFWPLLTDASSTTEGPVTALDEQWSGMVVKNYAALKAGGTTWPEGATDNADRTTQRNVIIGEQWTKAEDDDPGRYISFGVQAPEGQTLKVNNISMYVGGAGGSGMMCHIYYSTDGFQTRSTIFAPSSMTSNTMYAVEAQPVVTLESGQTLEVRIYPWYNSDASGKTICLADVTIGGQSEGKAGLENEPATVTFPFNEGTEGQTATFGPDEKMGAYFKSSYVEVGSNLTLKDVATVSGEKQTRFQPSISNEGQANDGNAINFYFIPKQGMIFTPTHISFRTTRYGTDGGKVDASWVAADGTVTSIESAISPARNNATPSITQVSKDVVGANGSDGLCGLRLNLYSLGNTKQVGFSDIVIEGTLIGSPQDARQCRLSVNLADEAAGTLTVTPNSPVFDEGDAVTLSVAENFGYHFVAWVDAATSAQVSTENPYTFNITDDTSLTATFSKANTYALNLTLTEGARENLVQIQPEGTMIGGKRMYEEGTDVKLTALSNKVLTFIGWEDQSTDAERTVRMDREKNLTAQFSAQDYIVGWDFYYDQPNSERTADYKSDSENAGLLSLHNAAGTTSTWLTRGVGNGQENGRYAARIWRDRSLGLYFEASFSTKGYKNIRVTSSLGCSYNTYRTNHLQYSTDGVNYQTVETFDISSRGWFDKEDVQLPADADEQDRVWVRWMPDRESELVGAETDYDGLAISDIFVTADQGALADEVATLVSSNPATGATGVSANGSIVLTFDKKIKAGEGKALLNGEELVPTISGKSAVFRYTGLKYNTQYTFQMGEGVLLSRSGKPVAAATVTFTTMERQQPQHRLYDAVVAQDGSGDYLSVQAAIDAAPAGRALPWLIFIKNGEYKEHVDVPATKPYLHFIGQTRDGVVIKDDRLSGGDNAVHVSVGATVVVNANNTFFENLTMENIWGHERQAGPQALALNTGGDRIALNGVRLLSYQDTWITTSTSNNRHYIRNSVIEGAVDFIYNSGNVFLDGDTLEINRPSGGFIVAPSHAADVKWGYVFMNNVLRPVAGMNVTDIWLGRPWHNQPKTVFVNLQTFINIPAAGWYETMGGLPALWADYNTVDAQGNPVDLSQRRDTYYYTDANGERVYGTAKNYLTDEEAAQYTIKNVVGGDDNWQPDLMCEACEAPEVQIDGTLLKWQPVPYAICYVVTRGDEVMGFTTETSFVAADAGDSYRVQAVNEFGGLSQPGVAGGTSKIVGSIGTRPMAIATYSLDGKCCTNQQKGVNIVRHADGTVHKMIR